MSRKVLFRTKVYPYHINARVNNRENFPGEMEFVWKTITGELYLQTVLHGLRIHAFVLMPNHFHLLASSPEADICKPMQEILSSSTRILNTRNRRSGRVFGARYYWSVILSPTYYAHALKYVYRNPVKASLCQGVADYPFSSLTCLSGRRHLPIPILPPLNGLDGLLSNRSNNELEDWLNQAHSGEENESIRKALRRATFKLPIDRKTRRPLKIQNEL